MVAISVPQIQLCSQLTVDLDSEISSHNTNGTLYRVAAIVAGVALTILLMNASLIGLGLINPPAMWVIAVELLGLIASTLGLQSFWQQGTEEFAASASLTTIAAKLATISHWQEDDIKIYLAGHGLELPEGEIKSHLAEINPDQPFKALLPLIARELVLKDQADAYKDLAARHTKGLINHVQNPALQRRYITKIMEARNGLASATLHRAFHLQQMKMPHHEYILLPTEAGPLSIYNKNNPEGLPFGFVFPKNIDQLMFSYLEIPGTVKDNRVFFKPRSLDEDQNNIAFHKRESLSLDDFLGDLDVPIAEEVLEISSPLAVHEAEEHRPTSPLRDLIPGRSSGAVKSVADIRKEIFRDELFV